MTSYRDNDTSVIRSPATKKAGRLDAYGAVSVSYTHLDVYKRQLYDTENDCGIR